MKGERWGGTMIWRESADTATVKGEAELTLVGEYVTTWDDYYRVAEGRRLVPYLSSRCSVSRRKRVT